MFLFIVFSIRALILKPTQLLTLTILHLNNIMIKLFNLIVIITIMCFKLKNIDHAKNIKKTKPKL